MEYPVKIKKTNPKLAKIIVAQYGGADGVYYSMFLQSHVLYLNYKDTERKEWLPMTRYEKYEHWLDIAEYDLETANAMLIGGRWLYVVFMCQQSIEKLAKGLYVLYVDDDIPRTHNIRFVIGKYEKLLPEQIPDKYKDFFEDLTAFYINGRYTDYKKKLSERLNESEAKSYYEKAKEVFTWLLTMKP